MRLIYRPLGPPRCATGHIAGPGINLVGVYWT
jgi:hypothetical protein